jgi:hypothetical protein
MALDSYQWEQSKLLGHANNARLSTAQALMEFPRDNEMKEAPQLPYFLDLASSDFHLLGQVKGPLLGCPFVDTDQLLQAILALLKGIDKQDSRRFFSSGWSD